MIFGGVCCVRLGVITAADDSTTFSRANGQLIKSINSVSQARQSRERDYTVAGTQSYLKAAGTGY